MSTWFCNPLVLLGTPPALDRLTGFFGSAATPGFAGDPGGGGCAAFKRSLDIGPLPVDPRLSPPARVAVAPCIARCDASAGAFGLCR